MARGAVARDPPWLFVPPRVGAHRSGSPYMGT
jgi:hypothetical protein